MSILDEKQLKTLAERGKFPIYLYWDASNYKVILDVNKRADVIGCIWKNPFAEVKTKAFEPSSVTNVGETGRAANVTGASSAINVSEPNRAAEISVSHGGVGLSEQEICEKVAGIIEEELRVWPEQVVCSAILTDDLGADSLDVQLVVGTLEKTFGIAIPDAEAERLHSVEDFQRICIRLLAEKRSTK